MDAATSLLLRADAIADGYMAESMDRLGDAAAPFDESEIAALRESFKTGWLMGYRAALDGAIEQLKEAEDAGA